MILGLLRAVLAFTVVGGYAVVAPKGYEATCAVRAADGALTPLVVRDESPERARAACNDRARRTAERASAVVLRERNTPSKAELAVADFVVAHPELAREPAPRPVGRSPSETEKTVLEVERAKAQRELKRIQELAPPGADNPFSDSTPRVNGSRLKLRILEIEERLRQFDAAPAAAPAASADVRLLGELRVLVDAARAATAPPQPRSEAAIVEAVLPTTPVEPRLNFLLFVAAIAGLAAGGFPPLFASFRRPELDDAEPPASLNVSERSGPGVEAQPAVSLVPASTTPAAAPERPAASPVMAYPIDWVPTVDPGRIPRELVAEFGTHAAEGCFVVGVTSTLSSAALRTQAVVRLAGASAGAAELLVLVMEADFVRPELHRAMHLGIAPDVDFGLQLEQRMRGRTGEPWKVLKCTPSVHALATPTSAPNLVLSTFFERCMDELRPFYDVIVVHGPVVSDIPQCRALDDVLDALVIVRDAREERSSIVIDESYRSDKRTFDFPVEGTTP
jgi:Mrp family chromosome partitioning ATPase